MIRFGVIGTNWITDRFIDAASEAEDFELTAVYSRTSERAAEFAGKYGIEATFTDLERMAESREIDAVYIASPNTFHAEQSIIFMEHGKHVLCEKPMAPNTAELTEMIQVAKKNNVLLMEALKTSFLPNFNAIQQNLHKVGKVRRFFASYCQYSSRYDAYKRGTILNAFNPDYSGGGLMDIGIYCIYPLIVLFGEPEKVQANGILLDSGVDGEGSILMQYEDKEAVVMYSKITDSALPSEIQGENGRIVIDKIHTPEKVEIHYRDGTIEDITKPQKNKSMYYEVKEFVELLQKGRTVSEVNSYRHSKGTMNVLDKTRKQLGVKFPGDSE